MLVTGSRDERRKISTANHFCVVEVLDGDDIVVRIPGEGDVDIHYVGIDAPEINHPMFGVEPGGPEAAQANRDVALRKWVRLEFDAAKVDPFARILAYVWVHQSDGSEVMANAELVWRLRPRAEPSAEYQVRFLFPRTPDEGARPRCRSLVVGDRESLGFAAIRRSSVARKGTTRRAGARPSTRPGWSTRQRARPGPAGSARRGTRRGERRGRR